MTVGSRLTLRKEDRLDRLDHRPKLAFKCYLNCKSILNCYVMGKTMSRKEIKVGVKWRDRGNKSGSQKKTDNLVCVGLGI